MNLSEKVVAVHLTVSVWTGKKIDRGISIEVARSHGVAPNVGAYKKRLCPPDWLSKPRSQARNARNFHKKKTLPWFLEEGVGLLPITDLIAYTEGERKIQESFQKSVTYVVSNWPRLIETAKVYLGPMFDPDDYPSQDEIRSKFDFKVGMMQLPDASKLPDILQQDEAAEVRAQLSDYISTGVAVAMEHLWDQFRQGLKNVAGLIDDPDGKLRSNTVRNLRQLCDTVAKLNITEDPKLTEIRLEAERFAADLDSAAVSHDPAARARASQQVDAIMNKFDKFKGVLPGTITS